MDIIGSKPAMGFSINEDFAKKYEEKKRREELSKLQDKYGPDYDPEDDDGDESEASTEYSSEDSDAEFVTPEVDAAILKIIGRIRQGDQEIYSAQGKDFFKEEEERLAQLAASQGTSKTPGKTKKGKKEKVVHLKDYQRNALIATGGQGFSDDEDAAGSANAFRTPAQEQEDLRQETKAAFLSAVDGPDSDPDGDDEDGLLVRRDAAGDSDEDEDQYRKFLLANVGKEELDRALAIRVENERAAKATSQDSTAPSDKAASTSNNDDDFLKNYILNRGWLDKKSKHIPSYKEITTGPEASTSGTSSYTPSGSNAINLLEDDSEEEFEKAEEFETKYNFRFEEQAGGEIQTHARDMTTSIRRVDDSRKREREARAARKAEEKQQKMEELKRLKSLKKQEIMEKIEKIKEIAGDVEGFDYSALDLEGEYDPEKHKAVMSKVFNEHYYEGEETNANGKPVWDDDIDISDIVPSFDKHDEAYAPGGEAYDPTAPGPSGKKSRAERKKDKKKKKKGKERDDAPEQGGEEGGHDEDDDLSYPAGVTNGEGGSRSHAKGTELDPEELDAIADPGERRKKIEQYMDELYKLDYEDMIGDLPTRFHYTTSALNKRGTLEADPYTLTPAEILMATDAELNAFESLRKIAPYRQDGSERMNKKRKKLKELRKVLARRRWGDELPGEGEEFVGHGAKYAHAAAGGARPSGAASADKKRKAGSSSNDATSTGDAQHNSGEPKKKKRAGAKERKKLRARAEAQGQATGAGEEA